MLPDFDCNFDSVIEFDCYFSPSSIEVHRLVCQFSVVTGLVLIASVTVQFDCHY
jgi:hypothetical protein